MQGRLHGALVALIFVVLAAGTSGASTGAGQLLHVHEVTAASAGSLAIRTPAAATATWCGTPTETDRTPNVVAGHPVHWIYAIPSDAPDRFATFANVMQTDAEAIDAWWRRQDPTRTPRNDLTRLTCGVQLDLTSRRFGPTGFELEGDFGFGEIHESLGSAGFNSRRREVRRVLRRLGRGGGRASLRPRGTDGSGLGLAVVYVQACLGVSTAAVAAHEILHTLGAVPKCRTRTTATATCAATRATSCSRRSATRRSRRRCSTPGRDDYYGHSCRFPRTSRTLAGSSSSIARRRSA